MSPIRRALVALATLAVLALQPGLGAREQATGQEVPGSLYAGLRWREIGPFRGGRVLAVSGVPDDIDTYYLGAVVGGVWKTTDGGHAWTGLFQHESVSSIGAIAVAPSNPNILYVGTGESAPREDISFGDGIYKSTDAGRTWTHCGLPDSRHIAKILVDPSNPDIVLAAALGHVYGPNAERGVFRSTDGGATWRRVLYLDDRTGAIDSGVGARRARNGLRGALAAAPHALESLERRAGQRHLQVDRRRRHVDQCQRRPDVDRWLVLGGRRAAIGRQRAA